MNPTPQPPPHFVERGRKKNSQNRPLSTWWGGAATRVAGWGLICIFICVSLLCNKPKDPHADHVMPPGQISGASLYQFHDMFTDQNGKTMMLHELSGKYVVVAMFYATCTAICPRIAAEMLRLEKSLSSSQREKTRFVMISFDHERDNPAALRKFIEKMRLTDSFILLNGKPNAVREVSAALGISYKKLDNGEYSHSSLFTLLSPQGEISMQHAGLSVDTAKFKGAIQ